MHTQNWSGGLPADGASALGGGSGMLGMVVSNGSSVREKDMGREIG